MASRLMLSLKKASVKPKAMWSLQTMTNHIWGGTMEEGTIRFAPRNTRVSREISLPHLGPEEGEDIVLEIAISSPRNQGLGEAL